MVIQNRSYEVQLMNPSSGSLVKGPSFPVTGKAEDAKKAALKQARFFLETYSKDNYDEDYVLYCIVLTDEDTLYLDSEGNEDVNPIDWFA